MVSDLVNVCSREDSWHNLFDKWSILGAHSKWSSGHVLELVMKSSFLVELLNSLGSQTLIITVKIGIQVQALTKIICKLFPL